MVASRGLTNRSHSGKDPPCDARRVNEFDLRNTIAR